MMMRNQVVEATGSPKYSPIFPGKKKFLYQKWRFFFAWNFHYRNIWQKLMSTETTQWGQPGSWHDIIPHWWKEKLEARMGN